MTCCIKLFWQHALISCLWHPDNGQVFFPWYLPHVLVHYFKPLKNDRYAAAHISWQFTTIDGSQISGFYSLLLNVTLLKYLIEIALLVNSQLPLWLTGKRPAQYWNSYFKNIFFFRTRENSRCVSVKISIIRACFFFSFCDADTHTLFLCEQIIISHTHSHTYLIPLVLQRHSKPGCNLSL